LTDNVIALNAELDRKALEIDAQRPPAFTDEALALRFASKHADSLRYVAALGRWFAYTGTYWRLDDTLFAFDRARHICREASAECNKDKISSVLASAKTVSAVERLAKADRKLVAMMDQWDPDLMSLNTPSGTIDLRDGSLRPHNASDYCSRITAVAPGGVCPTWHKFLDRVTDCNHDLKAFLQRVAGYSLTGLTSEHALFFLYGLGANGKSVFLNTLAGVLGEYHRTAPIETFTASAHDRHPTDLAGLRGARFVTASETEEGRRWAESKIKQMTGGDKIAARFMRGDFFEFSPQFKLVIAGNHRPGLRSVDESIRRRFNLIPFTVHIPPEERDEKLAERLKEEWPGILSWMVEGCLAWQRDGLNPPDIVKAATAEYLEAEDALSCWIEEKCDRGPQARETSTDLFVSWKNWADAAGESSGTQRRFSQKLEDRGFEKIRDRYGRSFVGIRLKSGGYHEA
jgi:putative DNA primase/helicase